MPPADEGEHVVPLQQSACEVHFVRQHEGAEHSTVHAALSKVNPRSHAIASSGTQTPLVEQMVPLQQPPPHGAPQHDGGLHLKA